MIDQVSIRICQIVPRNQIKHISVPVKLLYDELVREKEILPLSQLSREEKLSYWNETEGERFQRIV